MQLNPAMPGITASGRLINARRHIVDLADNTDIPFGKQVVDAALKNEWPVVLVLFMMTILQCYIVQPDRYWKLWANTDIDIGEGVRSVQWRYIGGYSQYM